MLQAIIDIGSNTVRMAVYRIDESGLNMLFKRKHAVGLAAYVKDGIMSQKGIDKTVDILLEYREFLAGFGIKEITAFTTAALRGAKNGREAVEEISRRTNLPVTVISGEEEAAYDFVGASHDLKSDNGLIIDIGGASTEIIAFADGKIREKVSLDFGSLTMFKKYVEDIMPSVEEIADIKKEAAEAVKNCAALKDVPPCEEICGIGGTFKGALALYNAFFHEDAGNVVMNAEKLATAAMRFRRGAERAISEDDTILLMQTVPDRLQTIMPGVAVALTLAEIFGGKFIRYSDSGVREGYIYSNIIVKA